VFIALGNVSITVASGEFVAVMGPSGCGKTTLLNLLAGIDRPSGGEIWLGGERIDRLNERQLAYLRRRKIGLVFQSFNLLQNMNILENVMLPALLAGISTSKARQQAATLLDSLGVVDYQHRLPTQLSGGQQQRVALARALINKPQVLLADEPTGNLDERTGQDAIHLLQTFAAQEQQTIILVTHDVRVALKAERVLVMRDGHVINEVNMHTAQTDETMKEHLLAQLSQVDLLPIAQPSSHTGDTTDSTYL
jgi:putative ABC transport system ATP-binding protein